MNTVMNTVIRTVKSKVNNLSLGFYFKANSFALALMLVMFVMVADAHAQGANHQLYYDACLNLLFLIEGPFGALIAAAAGIGAIVASAVGGFKMAWTLVVVAVGAFILRAYITLFFPDCGCQTCGTGGGLGGGLIPGLGF